MLILLDFMIVAACVGFLFNEGLWGNMLRLINTVLAALLAMSFYEPVAGMLAGMLPSFTYFSDFIALWGLFTVFILVFSLITNQLSKVKVKFMTLVDRIGAAVMAVWVGWVMICFTMTSLHVAPLAREPFSGSFVAEQRAESSLAPDMLWLGFVHQLSLGAYANGNTFDPQSEFMLRYVKRRTKLEEHATTSKALRIRPEDWKNHY